MRKSRNRNIEKITDLNDINGFLIFNAQVLCFNGKNMDLNPKLKKLEIIEYHFHGRFFSKYVLNPHVGRKDDPNFS